MEISSASWRSKLQSLMAAICSTRSTGCALRSGSNSIRDMGSAWESVDDRNALQLNYLSHARANGQPTVTLGQGADSAEGGSTLPRLSSVDDRTLTVKNVLTVPARAHEMSVTMRRSEETVGAHPSAG